MIAGYRPVLVQVLSGSDFWILHALARLPVFIDPNRRINRGKWRFAENEVGGFLGNHDRWRIDVAIGDSGENGSIHDAQTLKPDNTALRINHGTWIVDLSHSGCAARVISAFNILTYPRVDGIVGGNLKTGLDLIAAERVHRGLGNDLTCEADALAPGGDIIFMLKIVEADARVSIRIGRCNLNPAATLGFVRPDMNLKPVSLD